MLFSVSVMQFSHCPNVPKTILNKRFWNCVMFYVNKKRTKIQNTKLRIECGTFFGQWKKCVYFSENIRPLTIQLLEISKTRPYHFFFTAQINYYWEWGLDVDFLVFIACVKYNFIQSFLKCTARKRSLEIEWRRHNLLIPWSHHKRLWADYSAETKEF